ncbi:MAG: YjjG family noncanonical pyrimidine nucleotidase [Duncaniella sp.]|nr:YjjG family noncanonical pyrimidine nucleotidase [Duncaniella sp.]
MNSDLLTKPVMEAFRAYTAGVRWVWLDLDDTLIDFRANSIAALYATYSCCQLDRYFDSCDEWVDSYLRHNHALWDLYNRAEITQAYLRMHRFLDPVREKCPGISEESFTDEANRLDKVYLDLLAQQKCMVDGAVELVRHLRAHSYNIGVLSNGFTDVQHRKLHAVGLDKLVDAVVLSDDIGVNKPDPRIYRHAMERSGDTDPARHIMIGDNPSTDIAGALASGWRAVLYDPAVTQAVLTAGGLAVPSLRLLPSLFQGV